MTDSSLTFTAKNFKIITIDRQVTLRGPVLTELERDNIQNYGGATAGQTQVDDDIEVARL